MSASPAGSAKGKGFSLARFARFEAAENAEKGKSYFWGGICNGALTLRSLRALREENSLDLFFLALQGREERSFFRRQAGRASEKGFALEEGIGCLESRDNYFWATHAGAELDLLVRSGGNITDLYLNMLTKMIK